MLGSVDFEPPLAQIHPSQSPQPKLTTRLAMPLQIAPIPKVGGDHHRQTKPKRFPHGPFQITGPRRHEPPRITQPLHHPIPTSRRDDADVTHPTLGGKTERLK
jgi:hypothetical protein